MHTIADGLKAWREAMKLTQKDAATHLRMPVRTYQDYERGERQPGAESIERFARGGINTNWLFSGEGAMFSKDIADGGITAAPEEVRQIKPADGLNVALVTACMNAVVEVLLPDETDMSADEEAHLVNALYARFMKVKRNATQEDVADYLRYCLENSPQKAG